MVDLAGAHLRALAALLGPEPPSGVVNLGSGVGTSVRELVEQVCRRLGTRERPALGERRSGDAPVLLASIARARALLGWKPERGLADILDDAIWWESTAGALRT